MTAILIGMVIVAFAVGYLLRDRTADAESNRILTDNLKLREDNNELWQLLLHTRGLKIPKVSINELEVSELPHISTKPPSMGASATGMPDLFARQRQSIAEDLRKAQEQGKA